MLLNFQIGMTILLVGLVVTHIVQVELRSRKDRRKIEEEWQRVLAEYREVLGKLEWMAEAGACIAEAKAEDERKRALVDKQ